MAAPPLLQPARTITDVTLFAGWVAGLWILECFLDLVLTRLNLSRLSPSPPPELASDWDPDRYSKCCSYLREKSRLGSLRAVAEVVLILLFVFFSGIPLADALARSLSAGPVLTGLVFFAILGLLRMALSLPFAALDAFGVEARYGFNRMTPKVFAVDALKGLLVGVVLGAPLAALILFIFIDHPEGAGWIGWAAYNGFVVLVSFLAPTFLLPLFNKFEPLEAGPLRSRIETYARAQGFGLDHIHVMDGSKRSSKSNAFFTGFGKLRRLVLFDTLLKQQSEDEIMAIVAHEAGHFRLGHIPKSLGMQLAMSLPLFVGFAYAIRSGWIFEAWGVTDPSVHVGMVFASFSISPIMRLLSPLQTAMSRKFEYEADSFAVRTSGLSAALVTSLRKLHRDNFSHLSPHPAKVFFDYTHPPALQRIRAIERESSAPGA